MSAAPAVVDATGPAFLTQLSGALAQAWDAQVHQANTYSTTGTASAYVITPAPALVANAANVRYNVNAILAGIGTPTMQVGANPALPLVTYSNLGALVAYLPSAGQNFDMVCDLTATHWVVVDPLGAGMFNAAQQTIVAQEGSAATPVAIYKAGVLSTNTSAYTVTLSTSYGTFYDLLQSANMTNTLTLPANFFVPGKTIKIEGNCIWVATGNLGGIVTIKLLLGGVSVISQVVSAGYVSATSTLQFVLLIQCQAVGAAGVAKFNVTFSATDVSFPTPAPIALQLTAGLSTLVANAIALQMSAASGNGVHTVQVTNVVISVLG